MAWYDSFMPSGGDSWGYAKDPMAWLAALGTGAGLYGMGSSISQANQYPRYAEHLRRQNLALNTDYMNRLAAAQGQNIAREEGWRNQVTGFMNNPLDLANALPKTVSDEIIRRTSGDVSAIGLQPGGAYYAAIGEKLGPAQLEAALTKRNQDINALLGQRPRFEFNPAQPVYQQPYSPWGLQHPQMGDVSALGKYLQYNRQQTAYEKAQAEQARATAAWREELLKRMPVPSAGASPYGTPTGANTPMPPGYGATPYGQGTFGGAMDIPNPYNEYNAGAGY